MAAAKKMVLVRTYSAGVHFGEMVKRSGKEVELRNARRIWRWRGAHSLSELSQRGLDHSWSRVSEPVPSILLTEAIEIIACSTAAVKSIASCGWAQ